MREANDRRGSCGYAGRGFTLIELLVVVAIIALLVGVLLPALGGARRSGYTLKCAQNMRNVAIAVNSYIAETEVYPPSYVYGSQQTGPTWREADQLETNPNPANGYVHWSYFVMGDGDKSVGDDAFTCPATHKGGAPRSNPGPDPDDWEPDQNNDLGQQQPSDFPEDRQAKRMAFTGNAAIFPRNKFSMQGSIRKNKLVKGALVQGAASTILATEFLESAGWKSVFDGYISKSHRPVTPFLGGSAGSDVFNEPEFGGQPRFFYPSEDSILPDGQLGEGMIVNANSNLNAVGRHHDGGDRRVGGTANFLFVDGHVARMTVLKSVQDRLWGDRFYSLTGKNTAVSKDPL